MSDQDTTLAPDSASKPRKKVERRKAPEGLTASDLLELHATTMDIVNSVNEQLIGFVSGAESTVQAKIDRIWLKIEALKDAGENCVTLTRKAIESTVAETGSPDGIPAEIKRSIVSRRSIIDANKKLIERMVKIDPNYDCSFQETQIATLESEIQQLMTENGLDTEPAGPGRKKRKVATDEY